MSTLTLNVTRKCNLKCDYCFEDSEWRKGGNMAFSIAKKAIDTFFTAPSNTPDWMVIFTGGEPLLNFNLLKEVVEYIDIKKLKVEYKIKTNATLLDDEKMDFLIKNNIKIQVSLDGNEKAHDTHRKFANGKGTFNIVDKAIRKLIDSGYGSKVTISGTLTHQTTQYVDDCYSQLNTYSEIKWYGLKAVMPYSHNCHPLDYEDGKKAYISGIKNNKYFIQLKQKMMDANMGLTICGIGIWNITIDIDGKIYPCYRMCGNTKYIIGHLDFFEIPFKLTKDLENIYCLENNSQCANCFMINVCKIGCYADKLMYNYDKNKCFQSTKEMICNEFINKRIYQTLSII